MTVLDRLQKTDRRSSLLVMSISLKPDCDTAINVGRVHVTTLKFASPRMVSNSRANVVPQMFVGFRAILWGEFLTNQVHSKVRELARVFP